MKRGDGACKERGFAVSNVFWDPNGKIGMRVVGEQPVLQLDDEVMQQPCLIQMEALVEMISTLFGQAAVGTGRLDG